MFVLLLYSSLMSLEFEISSQCLDCHFISSKQMVHALQGGVKLISTQDRFCMSSPSMVNWFEQNGNVERLQGSAAEHRQCKGAKSVGQEQRYLAKGVCRNNWGRGQRVQSFQIFLAFSS